jgi:hypothetical protein
VGSIPITRSTFNAKDMKNMRMYPVFSILLTLAISISSQAATEPVTSPEQQYADDVYARGDYPAAMKLYLPLAKDGDNFAQYRVSFMYLEGQGVEADLVEAYAWASLAAQQGQSALLTYRDTVASLVPEDQRSKAVRTADYYTRKWGRDDYADEYAKAVRKEMSNCTGSRLGSRCEDVESMDMPQFWAIQSASSEGGGGTAKASGSTSVSTVHGKGSPRDVAYYQQLRDSLRQMNSSISENAGRVEVHEIEPLDESAPEADPETEDPEGN